MKCLYVHILNGECPPGLDKMCEISYDFRKVISRACFFFTFSDWSELEICVDYNTHFDIQYIFFIKGRQNV